MQNSKRPLIGMVGCFILVCGFPLAASAVDCQDYASGMRWLAGIPFSFSGHSDIDFNGNFAYVAANNLRVVDISDPRNPVDQGQVTGSWANPRRVDATADLLCTTLWDYGIEIYTLAQPFSPQRLLRYQTPAAASDVCLVGDIAYVACLDIGLVVLDLSDPQNPVHLTTVPSEGCVRVTHQANRLYAVCDLASGRALVVYHLADPTNPVQGFTWNVGAIDVVPAGDRLYVACALDGLTVMSLTYPSNPSYVGTFDNGGFVWTGIGFDDYAFTVYSGAANLTCIRAPADGPFEDIDTVPTTPFPKVIKFHDDHAYLVGTDGLDVFDLRQPESAAQLLGYHEESFRHEIFNVAARGGYAYLTNEGLNLGEGTFEIFDVSDPSLPTRLSYLTVPETSFQDITLAGSHAYLADFYGVMVIDITDPVAAVIVGRVDTPGYAVASAVTNGHLYIADETLGLQIASLLPNPTHPEIVGGLDTFGDAQAVAVHGHEALVIEEGGVLDVIDVSDPSAPVLIGQLDGLDFADNISLQGNYAYVDGSTEIYVVDISDPAAPALVGSAAVPASAEDLVADGGALYVACRAAGMHVVDILDPTAPQLLGGLDLEYLSFGIDVAEGVVHVASLTRLNLAAIDCLSITAATEETPVWPETPALSAHPNPFNPQTRIEYTLAADATVSLEIHDLSGRRLRTLLDAAFQAAGAHELGWDGRGDRGEALPSGTYLLRLRTDRRAATCKLTLLR